MHQVNHCTEQYNNQRAIARLSTRVYDTYFRLVRCDHVRQTGEDVYLTCKVKFVWDAEKPVVSV